MKACRAASFPRKLCAHALPRALFSPSFPRPVRAGKGGVSLFAPLS